ncbi:MAG: DUF4123 domain-containing protein [Planctomycetes bacterium]|nr:DUF4123 domain-containing protein [Planctomycetota bacterium]
MLDDESAENLRRRLFAEPSCRLYAVLDGASVPKLPQKLWQEGPEHFCLFPGDLEPDMREVAPYVVALEPQDGFTRWLLQEGWGNHWGVFAASPADLRTMRGHFRSLIDVMDEDGRAMIFRFYDPRVLAVFLPTCRPDELAGMFAHVTCYTMEADDPAEALEFRFRDGQLNQRRWRLDAENK